jgi:hypothetical protein
MICLIGRTKRIIWLFFILIQHRQSQSLDYHGISQQALLKAPLFQSKMLKACDA